MSRSADAHGVRRQSPDRAANGFTLVEIIVALGILSIVLVALLPQLVVGIRSTGVARQVAQTKGVAQAVVERMRNLPFHISPDAGPFVDVLDNYYPNRSTVPATFACTSADGRAAAPPTGATGYVSSSATARCSYEPPLGGAFFRTVTQRASLDAGGSYTVVTDTQFLSNATPPVPVSTVSGYDSQTTGKDNPPASQIGVTVTVFSARNPSRRPVSVYTQISAQPPSTTLLRGRAGARGLEVGSVTLYPTTSDRTPLSLSAGLLNLAGSVSTSSKMTMNRGAISAVLASDSSAYGLSKVETAPPTTTTSLTNAVSGALPQGCAFACWGASSLNSVALSADGGLPNAGSASAPARSALTGSENNGFGFGTALDPAEVDASLGLTGNLVQVDTAASRTASTITPCTTSGSGYVAGAGFVTSTTTGVTGCATASTGVIRLFRTASAPDGVVRVELVAASASCQVSGTGHTATAVFDYQAVVQYWDQSKGTSGGYRTVGPFTKAAGSDLLAGIALTAVPVGANKKLSDYISSWSSLTSDRVKASAGGGVADVSMPGVVTISTQPTRLDPSITDANDHPSVISLTVGALSCHAEDQR